MWQVELSSSMTVNANDKLAQLAPLAQSDALASDAKFSAFYRQTHNEVVDYIKHGSRGDASELSPKARWVQQQLQESALPPSWSALPLTSEEGSAPQDFLAQIAPYAGEAAARLGVSPQIIAAHAALESGWGKKPLTGADGKNSYNLFGIKAGPGWKGEVVDALTTEHENGINSKRVDRFRSYADLRGAFSDYAALIASHPRFRAAVGVGNNVSAFADALARGGYATDPDYAKKLAQVAATLQRAK